jgi:hypothetical protein
MDPRDFRTWTSLADHPIFSSRAAAFADWSSDPDVYSDYQILPAVFKPEWYVHVDPPYPVDVQQAVAEKDLRNLAAVCAALSRNYSRFTHELFILDDFTVYVRLGTEKFDADIYPVHFDDSGVILQLFINSPLEIDELKFTAVSEIVPTLDSLLE